MTAEIETTENGASSSRFAAMAAVAKDFKGLRPAAEVLVKVTAVPTIFAAFDRATKVGGLPIERFTLLHGASAGGKTYFTIGLMLSFLMRDHPVFFVDAERSTPHEWLRKAMGPHADHPYFWAVKPKSYEQTRRDVRDFLVRVGKMRESGRLPPDTSALVVVDSLRKLVFEDEFKIIMQEARGETPGVNNRLAQQKARAHAAWLDELVVLLGETRTAMVAVAREMTDPNNTNPRAIKFGTNVKTQGGSAPFYDASLDVRSSFARRYGKKVPGALGETTLRAYGDAHRLDITKSKVSGKGEEYRASCLFHVSNGSLVPEGFDRGRDLVELGRRLGVVDGARSLAWGRHRWRSEDAAVKALHADPDLFAELDAEVRAVPL